MSETSELAKWIGAELKRIREELDLSPERVAAQILANGGQLTASYLRRIERGAQNITLERLNMPLKVYGMSIAEFFLPVLSQPRKAEDLALREQLQYMLDHDRPAVEPLVRMLKRQAARSKVTAKPKPRGPKNEKSRKGRADRKNQEGA